MKKCAAVRQSQCMTCIYSPINCGAGLDDEDRFGMCVKYRNIFGRKDDDKSGAKEGNRREVG